MRPCKCGCTSVFDVETTMGTVLSPYIRYSMQCVSCGTSTGYCSSRAEATKVWESMHVVLVSHEEAAKALDSLDDYARMPLGVDAVGPRELLEKYIKQQKERV